MNLMYYALSPQIRQDLICVREAIDLTFWIENDIVCPYGELSERFKELVLKTSDTFAGTVGSNPTLSATHLRISRKD